MRIVCLDLSKTQYYKELNVYIVGDTFERISLTEVNYNVVYPSYKKIIKNSEIVIFHPKKIIHISSN